MDNISQQHNKQGQQSQSQDKDSSNKKLLWEERRLELGLLARQFLEKSGFQNKTLWEILQLFGAVAVPIVLFLAGQSIQERSQIIADSNRNQEILSNYLEDMTELLLDYNLHNSQENGSNSEDDSEVNQVARAKTLNAVRRLGNDGDSKAQIIKFLYESGLIGKCQLTNQLEATNCQSAILHLYDAKLDETIVPSSLTQFPGIDLQRVELNKATLIGVDLTRAQLQRASLREVDLRGSLLTGANLFNAILEDAHLSGAYLSDANLNSAKLKGANLSNARLQNADLSYAVLTSANLDQADLQGANLKGAKLDKASLRSTDLKGAEYDSSTAFPINFNSFERGMILAE